MTTKTNAKNAENKFTDDDQMVYNEKEDVVEQDHYLPTDDLPFRKMLASPDKIHIGENILNVIASYDPLGHLKIHGLRIKTPYNFKDANQLEAFKGEYKEGIVYTEVDFACDDPEEVNFLIEMQNHGEIHLEVRNVYNISERYTSLYARVEGKEKKYNSLRPVISIVILSKSYFDDEFPIRFLRPHDARFDLYKNDLNLGLEIYLELDKDTSNLPRNLQILFEFLRTGKAPVDAPEYIMEAAKMMEKTNYTPEERRLADFYDRAYLKRASEDAYTKEQGRMEERAKAEEQIQEERAKRAEERAKAEEQIRRERAKAEAEKVAEKLEIAKSLLQAGLPAEDVAKHSKLALEDIEALAR